MEQPVVTLTSGAVRGRLDDGVSSFLGVPYAAPPFGPHRLQAPQPVKPWDGVRDATSYGPTVPKGDYPRFAQVLLPEVSIPGDECLNLNVWTPAGARDLPVLVWVHGGSYVQGSGSLPEYDGTAFARDGVVCVTVNYRLGAEGFLLLPDAPPNRGLLDLVAALEWVREEIAAFGGDPARVTLAGESAGAMAITALLAMPAARGLSARAVLGSGDAENVFTPVRAGLLAERFTATLDRPVRDVSPQQLGEASSGFSNQRPGPTAFPEWGEEALTLLPFQPTVDGEVLPEHPLTALATTTTPLLVGTTRDEFRLFTVPIGALDGVDDAALSAAAGVYGLGADAVAVYRDAHGTAGDALAALLGDWRFLLPALRIAEASGGPSWLYRFDGLDPADNDGLGSCHAADLPFFFDTVDQPALAPRIGAAPSRAAADTAHGAWVRFATTGDPGWPAYTVPTRTTGLLGDTLTAADDPAAAVRAAWGR